jgi:hypothetical protein
MKRGRKKGKEGERKGKKKETKGERGGKRKGGELSYAA